MKKLLIFVVSVILSAGCSSKANDTPTQTATAEIKLPTAKCGMCKRTIKTAVLEKAGASSITFSNDPPKLTAAVTYDPSKTTEDKICRAIADAGYNANNVIRDSAAYANLHSCCK